MRGKGVKQYRDTVYDNGRRFRHEYKYRIDAKQEVILQMKVLGAMQRDSHVRADGSYLVRSAYFDDIHDTCLSEKFSGCTPRSKFRIRYYNSDTSYIFLEKKSKVRGMCSKDSCRLTVEECKLFLHGNVPDITEDTPAEKKKLFTEVRIRGLVPKVIVTYERIPFDYNGSGVRVTFDRKVTSSKELNRFLSSDYAERPVLLCGDRILEVKWGNFMPRHIKDMLRLEDLNWIALSKYSMCRTFHL